MKKLMRKLAQLFHVLRFKIVRFVKPNYGIRELSESNDSVLNSMGKIRSDVDIQMYMRYELGWNNSSGAKSHEKKIIKPSNKRDFVRPSIDKVVEHID